MCLCVYVYLCVLLCVCMHLCVYVCIHVMRDVNFAVFTNNDLVLKIHFCLYNYPQNQVSDPQKFV